jgi:acyl carrier protein
MISAQLFRRALPNRKFGRERTSHKLLKIHATRNGWLLGGHFKTGNFGGASDTLLKKVIMENIKQQLKLITIQGLRITDRGPESLRDDAPLLGGDLGIDSIDILQLILEIERHFGIKLVDGEFDQAAWASINSLAATVEAKLTAKSAVKA